MYSNRILAFTLMALILNLAIPAFAQTYYLDAVNGDDSNPGTSNQPWRTLGKAQSVLAEGDKVHHQEEVKGKLKFVKSGEEQDEPTKEVMEIVGVALTVQAQIEAEEQAKAGN